MASLLMAYLNIFTGRNEVVAKVMFLEACVCPQGGKGVCLSACTGTPLPEQTHHHPPGTRQTPPGPGRWQTPLGPGRPPQTKQTPPQDQADPSGPGRPPRPSRPPPPGPGRNPRDQAETPPGSRLQQTVYERPVRILLECILVLSSLLYQL